ncbi:MAG: site-specific DNA-methyltransferase [Rhodospirillales bacterium]|nr:site-specific DNA-methyltransferase [Rhodospirillales bacterium]MDE2198891.1 site-specific DNA-methyltransferase [Rhodospirillales bacterium]MDE2576120.1 site-specific DNA-methyltransferase [Rhodospirillales bacterium]
MAAPPLAEAVSDIRTGDCLALLPELEAASVDVVVTSPPYNLGLGYRQYDDRRGEEEYLDWMVAVATALRRVLRADGSFFLNISGSSRRPWLPFELIVRLRPLFVLQNHITWIKSIATPGDSIGHYKPVGGARFLNHAHEHIFHLTLTGDVRLDRLAIGVPFKDKSNIARRGHARDLRCRGNTWFIPYDTVQSRAEKFHHPGTFPLALPAWCIRLHGRPGAVVLDPFMGTGTTLLAARAEGAHGIGIELDPSYVAIARARLGLARGQEGSSFPQPGLL